MTALGLKLTFLIYFLPPMAIPVMSFYDITIICSTFSMGKTTAHAQRKHHNLSALLPASPLKSPINTTAPKPHHLFLNLKFVPVTYIASFISFMRFLVLPSHYTEVFQCSSMTWGVKMVIYWGRGFHVFFKPLQKFFRILLCIVHCIPPCHI